MLLNLYHKVIHILTEKNIDKVIKQLPYHQSYNDFIDDAIDNWILKLKKDRTIK